MHFTGFLYPWLVALDCTGVDPGWLIVWFPCGLIVLTLCWLIVEFLVRSMVLLIGRFANGKIEWTLFLKTYFRK